jgi:hypothetical protein
MLRKKSLAKLAPSYKVASAYLFHMLEARFASLNPFMQYMFLKLHDIEDPEKKAFILETLRIEFRDIAIEAREVFKKFNKLGSPVEVVGTPNEDVRVPIPCKLGGIHDAWCKGKLTLSVFLVINDNPYRLMFSLSFL